MVSSPRCSPGWVDKPLSGDKPGCGVKSRRQVGVLIPALNLPAVGSWTRPCPTGVLKEVKKYKCSHLFFYPFLLVYFFFLVCLHI